VRGADENVESLNIESNLVGLIIGRAGENLRRVETETGCRVQFITGPDETGPYRQCKITGPRARRADAKAEIDRIINDSGMAGNARVTIDRPSREAPAAARTSSHQPALRDGEDSMQIMVPDRTVGLIIGRGGETIRDLQERSGCHVNIVGEQKSVNGLRPVNLIGTPEAATRAKDLIMEIVESDSKSTANKDRAPAQREPSRDAGYGAGYGASGGSGADKINDSIFVPSEAVGMIIGKGGETIKEMQSITGCKINVSQSSGPGEVEREIGLVGPRDAIAAAKRAIEDKVEAVVCLIGHLLAPLLTTHSNRKMQAGAVAVVVVTVLLKMTMATGLIPSHLSLNLKDKLNHKPPLQPHKMIHMQHVRDPSPSAWAPFANEQDGGYNAYVALWYQAMAQQQQAGQAQSDLSKPPGTS
jgi:far upstream element-binding protein